MSEETNEPTEAELTRRRALKGGAVAGLAGATAWAAPTVGGLGSVAAFGQGASATTTTAAPTTAAPTTAAPTTTTTTTCVPAPAGAATANFTVIGVDSSFAGIADWPGGTQTASTSLGNVVVSLPGGDVVIAKGFSVDTSGIACPPDSCTGAASTPSFNITSSAECNALAAFDQGTSGSSIGCSADAAASNSNAFIQVVITCS